MPTNPLAQDLGGVVRLLEKATPGEWHWVRRHDCYQIQAPHGGGTVVMDCVRHGMRGADFRFAVSLDGQPRGKRGGILMKATELGDATLGGFYHPDAAAMVECVNFLRTHSAEIAGALRDAERWRVWRELGEHEAADIAWLNAGEERDAALDAMQQGGGGGE